MPKNKKLLAAMLVFLNTISFVVHAKNEQFVATVSNISVVIQREMLEKGTYKSNCPVPPARLREIKFTYYDFDGVEHTDGSIIVLDAAVENVTEIFRELYDIKFPIAKIKRIELYNGDDEKSLADNNSVCFQCRSITNKPGIYSLHSYGLAIDINPWQNPYLGYYDLQQGTIKVLPPIGINYINRTNLRAGMVEHVRNIFQKNGFPIWGGAWNDPIDWQHIQTSRTVAKLLAVMTPDDAKIMFKLYVKNCQLLNKIPDDDDTLIKLYKSESDKFMQYFHDNYENINNMDPVKALKLLQKEIS